MILQLWIKRHQKQHLIFVCYDWTHEEIFEVLA